MTTERRPHPVETTCRDCGKRTEWVAEPTVTRTDDPVSPFPLCPWCAHHGRYQRRAMRMWRPQEQTR